MSLGDTVLGQRALGQDLETNKKQSTMSSMTRTFTWKVKSMTEQTKPVLVETPKPVKEMTEQEKDAFVDEILQAIEGNL